MTFAMSLFDNPLDVPLSAESAAALGQAGRRLRKTLDALQRYDTEVSSKQRPAVATQRAALVADAGDALWCYVVHREILGMQDADYISREYVVPDEVRKSMAPRRKTPS